MTDPTDRTPDADEYERELFGVGGRVTWAIVGALVNAGSLTPQTKPSVRRWRWVGWAHEAAQKIAAMPEFAARAALDAHVARLRAENARLREAALQADKVIRTVTFNQMPDGGLARAKALDALRHALDSTEHAP